MSTKKPATLRTYPVFDKISGKQRWIEAASRSEAIVRVYDPQVGEPLTAQQVAAVMREHGVDAVEAVETVETVAPAATKPE